MRSTATSALPPLLGDERTHLGHRGIDEIDPNATLARGQTPAGLTLPEGAFAARVSFKFLGASIRRREFIGLIGTAALSFPRLGYAETKTDLPVVGVLMTNKSETNTEGEGGRAP